MARTYSNGEEDLGRFSSNLEGIISILERPIWERSCFRRGEAEARTTRLLRIWLRAGRSRGGGGRRRREGVRRGVVVEGGMEEVVEEAS